jgi:hypothetical protein
MGEAEPGDVTVRVVEDLTPDERTARLTALLASGIERWLRGRGTVDFGRDMSVHHDGESERRTW